MLVWQLGLEDIVRLGQRLGTELKHWGDLLFRLLGECTIKIGLCVMCESLLILGRDRLNFDFDWLQDI